MIIKTYVVPELPMDDGNFPVCKISGKSLRVVAVFPRADYARFWAENANQRAAERKAERAKNRPPRQPRKPRQIPVIDPSENSPVAATSKVRTPVMVEAPTPSPVPEPKLIRIETKTPAQIGFMF